MLKILLWVRVKGGVADAVAADIKALALLVLGWQRIPVGVRRVNVVAHSIAIAIDRRAGDPLRLVGGAEVGAFIGSAIAHFSFFEFVILNAHIAFPDGVDAGTAVCRLFMCELRQDETTERFTTAFGLYHDRYVLETGRWWFAERRYHSLARHSGVLDVFSLPSDPGITVPGA